MSSVLPPQQIPPPPAVPLARFSVEQYHRMIESGAFTENDPLELIDGWVVTKMPKGPAHEYVTGQGEELLRDRIPPGWHVRNQAPITLSNGEPEPDLSVVQGDRSDYRTRHPAPGEAALVVEVSDSTLGTDHWKGAAYGAAGIAVYWIVNLPDRCVEVYTNPNDAEESGYETCDVFHEGDEAPVIVDGQDCGTIPVAELLP